MSVNWNWNRRKGYYILVEDGKEFKVNIYCGNCLGVEIYELNDGKYIFQGFWNDEKHLENMLGLNKGFNNLYENVKEIHLYTNYKGWELIARRFAKVKIKVVLEYEEICDDKYKEYIKKEWEKLGYKWIIPEDYPHMIYLVNDDENEKWVLTIKINTETKKYWKTWGDDSFEPITIQEHYLLSKMFELLVCKNE